MMKTARLSRIAYLSAVLLVLGCAGEGGSGSGAGGTAGGSTGTAGTSGTAGTTGSAGTTGNAGRGGATGTAGVSGAAGTGSAGTTGIAGATGNAGTTGAAGTGGGAAGAAGGGRGGSTGAAGATGTAGRGGSGGTGTAGSGGSGGTGSGGSGGAGDTVNATALAVAMGFGANIGNTLENTVTWETGWGQPLITQAFINGMASRGIKNVRVPVAWNTYATNGVIDATKMNRVKQVVDWILAAGMYAIVNIHWDGGWIDNEGNANKNKLTADVKTKFASYWTQISTAFASVGNKLIFEGLNEESKFYLNGDSTKPDYPALNELNQLFVTTVRAQGGYNPGRALLIAGFNTDIDSTCVDAFTVPTDPAGANKLLLSIHYYNPWTFCGLETVESWGSPATTWGTDAEKMTLQMYFTKLANCSTQKKVPVIIGEFGVTKGQGTYVRQSASRILWMQTVAKAALSHGMVPVLWDTATDINRTDGSFSAELQAVMASLK